MTPGPEQARVRGDYPTPDALAAAVVRCVVRGGARPARILEPSCGSGAFLRAAREAFGAAPRLIGLERDAAHAARARACVFGADVRVGDAAHADLAGLLREAGGGEILVVGNLPWITTDELARRGDGGPPRGNPTALRGLDARTGAAAFDVAEYYALRILEALAAAATRATFAVLLKDSVARRLVREVRRRAYPVVAAEVRAIDARAAFGVAVAASLLHLTLDPSGAALARVAVAPALDAPADEAWFVGDALVARDAALLRAPGCALRWRSGIKHDAAAVYVLTAEDGGLRNGLGERVDVEDDALAPLVTGAQLARGAGHDGRTYLVLPYRSLRDDEAALRARWPRTHRYLAGHADRLEARRSSVYRGAPRFAIFGVGPYAFAPWKVAVCGLRLLPRFVVVGGTPSPQLSDTAYALAVGGRADAELLAGAFASPPLAALARGAMFAGKRPVTKRLLDRLDPSLVAADPAALAALAASLGRTPKAVATRLRELATDGTDA